MATAEASTPPPLAVPPAPGRRPGLRRLVVAGVVLATVAAAAWWFFRPAAPSAGPGPRSAPSKAAPAAATAEVWLGPAQQRSIGLRTERVAAAAAPRVASTAGRIAPNEYEYAFITPRAAGVVRTVTGRIGQEVKAGEILATIDSPEVGVARLDLFAKVQELEIARSQADREATVSANTRDLLDLLRRQATPERVHEDFADRPVGANRERLVTAYAQFRLATATIERNRDLFAQRLITPKDFEQVRANFEVAQATYQSLLDEMGYEVRLENIRAQQARKQAENAVRAAQERLRILGVKSDGTEPEAQGGRIKDVNPDGSLPSEIIPPSVATLAGDKILPQGHPQLDKVAGSAGPHGNSDPTTAEAPVSTYSIWAPFDGTILDRELIVPGIAVDTTHRIFTIANLATVWVEANVQEGEFAVLDRTRRRGGTLRFRSPAYPERVFEAQLISTGDLVDEKSRSVKLLARAENPDRLLRPGMFVEAEVLNPRTVAVVQVAESALLTEADRAFVYVRTGPDQFVRRPVEAEPPRDEQVVIRSGLAVGEEVVVEGGYKLKAMAEQAESGG